MTTPGLVSERERIAEQILRMEMTDNTLMTNFKSRKKYYWLQDQLKKLKEEEDAGE